MQNLLKFRIVFLLLFLYFTYLCIYRITRTLKSIIPNNVDYILRPVKNPLFIKLNEEIKIGLVSENWERN